MNNTVNAVEIANRIKVLCDAHKISINQMLSDCSLGSSVVDNMKRGSLPTAEKVAAIASYLGVSTDYLIGNEQKNKPSIKMEGLTENEKLLLDSFRNMTDDAQNSFLKIAVAASAKIAEEEKK